MGVFVQLSGPLGAFTSQTSTPVLLVAGVASFIVLAVLLNVLKQLLFKKPNEPPVVFHWFPILGSTITYGMDPYKFFFANKAKVGFARQLFLCWALTQGSMATSSLLYFSAAR
jgi:hypothetical protein